MMLLQCASRIISVACWTMAFHDAHIPLVIREVAITAAAFCKAGTDLVRGMKAHLPSFLTRLPLRPHAACHAFGTTVNAWEPFLGEGTITAIAHASQEQEYGCRHPQDLEQCGGSRHCSKLFSTPSHDSSVEACPNPEKAYVKVHIIDK